MLILDFDDVSLITILVNSTNFNLPALLADILHKLLALCSASASALRLRSAMAASTRAVPVQLVFYRPMTASQHVEICRFGEILVTDIMPHDLCGMGAKNRLCLSRRQPCPYRLAKVVFNRFYISRSIS